jgi:hypothetical protein
LIDNDILYECGDVIQTNTILNLAGVWKASTKGGTSGRIHEQTIPG